MDKALFKLLYEAAESAFTDLFAEHDERYYYCTLVTTGDGACPYISAWSHEALARYVEENGIPEDEIIYCEWSYADSPYCIYGWDYFGDVEKYVNEHRSLSRDDDVRDNWYNLLMDTMERVMKKLDAQHVFGKGKRRSDMLVNAEVMPPDYTNTQRALRLNKKKNILRWLEEIAEPEDE